jgi:hypothetical protein
VRAGDLEQKLAAHRLREAVVAIGRHDEARGAADDRLGECRFEIIVDRTPAAFRGAAENGKAIDHDVGGERRAARFCYGHAAEAVRAVAEKSITLR